MPQIKSIRAISVCVHYSDLLAKSLSLWHVGCDRLVIITSSKDAATQELCRKYNVECFVTDVFWENGAKFNKAAAMAQCVLKLKLREGADWLLTFDSDIVPPDNWRGLMETARLNPGKLYGAYRYQQPENVARPVVDYKAKMKQGWVLGFFCAFHNSDRRLPPLKDPLFEIDHPHAGNYDTAFTRRWTAFDQVMLPIPMIHLGEERAHWTGRGKKGELQKEFFAKRRHIEDWQHERMTKPPVIA